MAKKTLRSMLLEDKTYRVVLKQLRGSDEKVEDWMQEIMSLHSRRAIRALNTTSLLSSSQKISIDSNIDNQAVRSRVTEIKMRCLQQLIVVERQTKRLRKYIWAQYADELSEMHRSITERKSEVDHQLNKLSRIQDNLQGVIKLADVLIDDVDAAGYTLKRIGDILTLKSKER